MKILHILQQIEAGKLSAHEAAEQMQFAPFQELVNGLNLDTHRALRTGQGECVLARNKSDEHLKSALHALSKNQTPVLATRVSPLQGQMLLKEFANGCFYEEAGLFTLNKPLNLAAPRPRTGELMIITAGSSDMPVALEALGTAQFYGLEAGLASDIGVAGLHRITPWLKSFTEAKILMVIAGMEGALPSVIAGLTGKPVLAVPTSVGYGVSAGGYAALMGMLSSCAAGISVFNIDNGYGAAVFARRVLEGQNNNE